MKTNVHFFLFGKHLDISLAITHLSVEDERRGRCQGQPPHTSQATLARGRLQLDDHLFIRTDHSFIVLKFHCVGMQQTRLLLIVLRVKVYLTTTALVLCLEGTGEITISMCLGDGGSWREGVGIVKCFARHCMHSRAGWCYGRPVKSYEVLWQTCQEL